MSEKLLSLENHRIVVWKCSKEMICIAYENCDVKDGIFLKSEFGQGHTFEEACQDYYAKITGKTLVFGYGDNREEIKVL